MDSNSRIIEIECPTGAKLRINSNDIPLFGKKDEAGTLLERIPKLGLEFLLSVSNGVDPVHDHPRPVDYELWDTQRKEPGIPRSFVVRISPIPKASDFRSKLQPLYESLLHYKPTSSREAATCKHLIQSFEVAYPELKGLANPEPARDGWGHAHEDDSVEGLLREGAAAEKGTDKHETLVREFLGEDNEKMVLNLLEKEFKQFKETTAKELNDLRHQIHNINDRAEDQAKILRGLRDVFLPEIHDED